MYYFLLSRLVPLGVIFFGIVSVYMVMRALPHIRSIVDLNGRSAPAAIFVLFFALFLSSLLPNYHVMYISEQWYIETARNIAAKGAAENCFYTDFETVACEPYLKMQGWPVVLSFSFALFGVSAQTAFETSAVLSALAAMLLFLLAKVFLKNNGAALLSAIIFSLDPLRLFWSTNVETNGPTLFFALFPVFVAAIIRESSETKIKAHSLFALFFSSLFIAASMRVEYSLLIAALFPMIRRKLPALKFNGYLLALLAVGFAILFLQIYALYTVQPSNDPAYSLQNLMNNSKVVALIVSSSPAYSLLFVLGITGLLLSFKKQFFFGTLAFLIFIFSVIALGWSEFAYFYQGRPLYYQDRFLLLPMSALIIMACFALFEVCKKSSVPRISFGMFGLAMTAFFVLQFPALELRLVSHDLQNDGVAALRGAVPNSACYVISENPLALYPTPGFRTLATKFAIARPERVQFIKEKTGCVFYFEDKYCWQGVLAKEDRLERCDLMARQYNLTEVFNLTGGSRVITLSKIT